MCTVKFDFLANVDIGESVAISETESLLIEIGPHPLQSAARHCFKPGIDQGYGPILGLRIEDAEFACTQVDLQVRGVAVIVRKNTL